MGSPKNLMHSGVAFGWVLTGLINDHIKEWTDDTIQFDPDECGPCAALRDFFLTPRGRSIMDTFIRTVPIVDGPWVWQNADGTVNWDYIDMILQWPKHKRETDDDD
jgi:hypothetical protein